MSEKWHWPRSPQEIWSDYRQNVWRFCELFPYALSAIAQLRALNFKLAIIIKGTVECQDAKMEHIGLTLLMDAMLISEREGVKKPAPELFLRACHRLDLMPEAYLMVGDSPAADGKAALDAGLQAVLLQRYETPVSAAVRTICSLLKLPSLLSQFSPIPSLAKIQ